MALAVPSAAFAQKNDKPGNREERSRWYKEMLQYKRDFMVKELQLTDEQKAKFIPIYDKMESETEAINRQTRQMMRSVEKKGSEATDLEYEKAAEATFELKSKEGAIDTKYYNELKTVLTPRQMFKFKNAENQFTRELMKHRKPHKK